ncbi:MAG: DEAD/DEAH box helicase, partial [Planctomycetota bacterium]
EPAFEGQTRPLPDTLDPRLRSALEQRGIRELYSHQARALELAREHRDFVVTTPTASGKSLCYHLPVLDELLADRGKKALYLFPTKALSRDQVADLNDLLKRLPDAPRVDVYDGDTPGDVRTLIRKESDIVVTNPYMLHTGILPNHPRWARLFRGLATIVVDELHTYSGVFGSHAANVFARLLRVAAHYGAQPRFVLCSATIANAAELARGLTGRSVAAITESGAPRGEKRTLLVNPPITNRELGLRRSAAEEARRLAVPLLKAGVQALFFERSRNGVEVLLKYLKDAALDAGFDPERVCGYRGGYLPDLRRSIERGLRDGNISIVVATNALELGVDIGSLDVVVLVGYPGSVSSTFQRAGRAGRRRGLSASFLIAKSSATDQYVMQHPDYLFGASPEHVTIDPKNVVIRTNQIKCAAFELPFREGEVFGGDARTGDVLDFLERDAHILRKVAGRYHWMARAFPAEDVALESGDIDNFTIYDIDRRTIMGEVDRPTAMTTIHEGAIYGHQGEPYLIVALDYEGRRAHAQKVQTDYYTEAVVQASIKVLHLDRSERCGGVARHLGHVSVVKLAPMFKKIRYYTRENVGAGEIKLPPEVLDTEAFMLTLDSVFAEQAGILAGGNTTSILGFGELLRKVAPLFVRCDHGDIGVVAELLSPHFDCPTIYLYDDIPGGVGLSEKAFALLPRLIAAMQEVLNGCPCATGCPVCIGAGVHEEPRDKAVVGRLVADILRDLRAAGAD